MGRHITLALLQAGYKVYTICRPGRHGEQFLSDMRRISASGTCYLLEADLSSRTSIDLALDLFLQRESSLDLLINNAGILCPALQTSEHGYEMHWAVNCIAPAYLCERLYKLMSAGSRICNTVSCTVWTGRIPGKDLFYPRKGAFRNRFTRYSNSKLGLLLYSISLSRRLKESGISVNAVDPGIVNTPILHLDKKIADRLCNLYFRPVIKQPREGAATMIYLALSPDVEGATGGFYKNSRRRKIPSWRLKDLIYLTDNVSKTLYPVQ